MFMVFLDRDFENNLELKNSLYLLTIAILMSSALVFFRFFPVAVSAECLEMDALLRPLFCYTNESDFPVDCADFTKNFTTAESSDSLNVVCYALATNIGIAVAAAVGFASLVAGLITIYIRASELWFRKKRSRLCHVVMSVLAYFKVSIAAVIYSVISIGPLLGSTTVATGDVAARHANILLVVLMFIPFVIIASKLQCHCQQSQYSSLSQDQVPSTYDLELRQWCKRW